MILQIDIPSNKNSKDKTIVYNNIIDMTNMKNTECRIVSLDNNRFNTIKTNYILNKNFGSLCNIGGINER